MGSEGFPGCRFEQRKWLPHDGSVKDERGETESGYVWLNESSVNLSILLSKPPVICVF